MNVCNQIIGFDEYRIGSGVQVRGFAKKTILIYKCPKCGQEHHIGKNWTGQIPSGGFVCGSEIMQETR